MPSAIEFNVYENRAAASAAAAALLARLLYSDLDTGPRSEASLVVSGGSTPGPCFDLLAATPLDWRRVTVVPSDERWVDTTHQDSNERLIRQRLLQDQTREGQLLPLYRGARSLAETPALIEQDLAGVKRPFSAALLGMGEDGHFASLFADSADLAGALDPHGKAACIVVQTVASPHPRISLTLSALLDSAHIVLLMFGAAKRQVFAAAQAGQGGYPVESLLQHARSPLTVIWAP